jgi:hypothetical protein
VLLAAIKGSAVGGWTAFLFLALALLTWAGTSVGMNQWARRAGRRFDALLDRIDLLARGAVPEPSADAEAPRLDLAALDEPSADAEAGSSRRRART